jgi:sec-independent protein translocase protein TatA
MKGFKKAMGEDDKEKDADFVAKETVEDKSVVNAGDTKNAETPIKQTKSEHKESN